MTDRIELRGIEVLAKHGVFEEEQRSAQMFRVDVTAHLDLSVPGESDDLSDTVDYGLLASEIREVVGGESHRLIERVSTRVAETILAHRRVQRVVVTVHKPNVPLDVTVADVAVTIERGR